MERDCCAVIVAAGSSTRMGCPKQLLPLLGEPALAWTLRAFEKAAAIRSIVLVIRKEDRAAMEEIAARCGVTKPLRFAAGGAERQLSVRAGLLAAPEGTQLAAVHDGARALITPEQIDAVVRAAGGEVGAALAVRVKDTIKIADENGLVVSTPARESLWAVQTPQVFPYPRLCAEMERAVSQGKLYTDDCQLWEHAGLPVRLCEGSYENLKLTTREDVFTAESILKKRRERACGSDTAMTYTV